MMIAAVALFCATVAQAQLRVSSQGKVAVGTTANAASTLSVNSAGNSNYAAYVKGNCKVDSGYVSANVFNPTNYSLFNVGYSGYAFQNLLQLHTRVYNQSFPLPNQIPPTSHLGISGPDMEDHFPGLMTINENGDTLVNYSELVPALVCTCQVLYKMIQWLDPNMVNQFMSEELGEEQAEEHPDQPLMAARRMMGATLYQNNPNPFTEKTVIRFRVPEQAKNAFIYIFDMTGKMLRQIPVDSTMQSVTVNGYELSEGMFLYSLVVNGQEIDTKRMILTK